MWAHLLNWTLGPAFLGAMFASFGCPPPAAPLALDQWLQMLGALASLGMFFVGAGLVLTALMAIVSRLIEGRFVWDQVRLFGAVMMVKAALIVLALVLLGSVFTAASAALGGWQGGWFAAVVGAMVGAAVGLPVGFAVALLRIPERLGLDKEVETPQPTR